MTLQQLIAQFHKDNGVTLDLTRRINMVSGNASTMADPEEIDSRIKQNILEHLLDETRQYEAHRHRMWMSAQNRPNDKKLQETVAKMPNAAEFLNSYLGLLSRVAENEAMKPDVKAAYKYEYKPLPMFGITGEEFANMVNQQIDSYSYLAGRRAQILDKKFAGYNVLSSEAYELGTIKTEDKTWRTATEEQKEDIYRTYITMEIMKQKLASKWWIWKQIFRKETRAMEGYIGAARSALTVLGFKIEDADAKNAVDAFAKRGYAKAEPTLKADALKLVDAAVKKQNEALSKALEERENAKSVYAAAQEEKLQKKYDDLIKQVNEKISKLENEAVKAEIAKANDPEKIITERFFEIRFRPSFDKEEYLKERETWHAFDPKKLSGLKQQQYVFKINTEKIKRMGEYFKLVDSGATEKEIQLERNRVIENFLEKENDLKKVVLMDTKGAPKEYKVLNLKELDERQNAKFNQALANEFAPDPNEKKQEPISQTEPAKKVEKTLE